MRTTVRMTLSSSTTSTWTAPACAGGAEGAGVGDAGGPVSADRSVSAACIAELCLAMATVLAFACTRCAPRAAVGTRAWHVRAFAAAGVVGDAHVQQSCRQVQHNARQERLSNYARMGG